MRSKPLVLVSPGVGSDNPGLFEEELGGLAELSFKTFRGGEYPPEVSEAEAMVLGLEPVDDQLLEHARRLRIVARYGVGYDTVDVEACTRRGIYVTHTPGVLSGAVADLTIGLILCLSRRLIQADRYVREEWWRPGRVRPLMGVDLRGKALGIIGLGRIGYEVARRAKAFDMRVLYHDLEPRREAEASLGLRYVDLETLLRSSDYVSVHVPLTPRTRRLLGERELRMMKPTAYLINTSRGQVIDEEALCKALKEGWISGAGLDVYEKEPLQGDSTLIKLDNVVLTPHIGSYTVETRRAMALMCIENVRAALEGKKPPNLVPEQKASSFIK